MEELVVWRGFGATVFTLCSGWCWKPEEDAEQPVEPEALDVCTAHPLAWTHFTLKFWL